MATDKMVLEVKGMYRQEPNGKWTCCVRFFCDGKYDPETDEILGPFETKEEAVKQLDEIKAAFTEELKKHPEMTEPEATHATNETLH